MLPTPFLVTNPTQRASKLAMNTTFYSALLRISAPLAYRSREEPARCHAPPRTLAAVEAPLVLSARSSPLSVRVDTSAAGRLGRREPEQRAPRGLRTAPAAAPRTRALCLLAQAIRRGRGSMLETLEHHQKRWGAYMYYVGGGGTGCAGGSCWGLILFLAILGAAFLMSTLFPFIL